MKAPRANTQKDVNQAIWSELQTDSRFDSSTEIRVFDNPCGQGEWLRFLHTQRPQWKFVGNDLFGPSSIESGIPCLHFDSSQAWAPELEKALATTEKFDLCTCISGVMAFDNLSLFFRQIHQLLKADGLLVVTNDNTWTLRDRWSYLIKGKVRRFKLNYNQVEGNWHHLSQATLNQILEKAGFEVTRVKYTSFYLEDFIWLPLALLIWPLQFLYRRTEKSDRPSSWREQMYPVKALFGRHYIFFAKKKKTS